MVNPSADALSTLKVLIDSSAPIVVMETVEEVRAVRLVRIACAALDLATFEWSIASGLVRCGNDGSELMVEARFPAVGTGHDATDLAAQAIYNSREPAQVLGVLEGISVEAAFILKDFHRHMEDPVVVRRLRDVGQQFSKNRRTVVIIAPSIKMPPELASLVEYVELPLPDRQRLRQIIDEMIVRVGKTRTLRRSLETSGLDAMAGNLRGLTEEQAERAVSQAIVTRYGLTPEIVTDVLQAKKEILRRSEMLDFSGAEIHAAIQAALYASFSSKQPLATSSLIDALAKTIPLSTTRGEEIQKLRDWARTRAVPASVADVKGEGA